MVDVVLSIMLIITVHLSSRPVSETAVNLLESSAAAAAAATGVFPAPWTCDLITRQAASRLPRRAVIVRQNRKTFYCIYIADID